MFKSFAAKLQSIAPAGAWTWLMLPFKVEEAFGSRARVTMTGTINGFAFRTSIVPKGDGTHHIMVNKAMQQGAKAKPCDAVKITLQRDEAAKTVEVPTEVKWALAKNKRAQAAFKKLAVASPRAHLCDQRGQKARNAPAPN